MKKQFIKWLKYNWLLIILLVIAFFFLRKWGNGYFEYRRNLRAAEDSIAVLDNMYQQLQDCLSVSQELASAAINEAESIRDSMRKENKQYENKIKWYEWKIANLKNVPTDTLYLDYVQWIDTVSFD